MDSFEIIHCSYNTFTYGFLACFVGIVVCLFWIAFSSKTAHFRDEMLWAAWTAFSIFGIVFLIAFPYKFTYETLPRSNIINVQKHDSTTVVVFKNEERFNVVETKDDFIFEYGSTENIQVYRKQDLSVVGEPVRVENPDVKLKIHERYNLNRY